MIVPHEGGALRRLSISMNFVVSMGAIFLFCFVSSAFLAQFFLGGMNAVGSDEKLRVEIQRLAAENAREKSAHKQSLQLLEQYSEKYDELRRAKGADEDAPMDAMGGGTFEVVEHDGLFVADEEWVGRAQAIHDRAHFDFQVMDEELCMLAAPPPEAEETSFWPVRGRITSGFGSRRDPFDGSRQFHEGVDIAAAWGSPVRVTEDGIVLEARRHGGYGNMVLVQHEDHKTLYGHLRRFSVTPGQKLQRGDVLGEVGSTGRSTGPHVHFERIEKDKPIDPAKFYG
jgi:murein DD-endopeptidase MepM/ murein hydrolase activator NlpD